MQAAIDRVMETYGMMVNLSPDQERDVREKVSRFLQDKGDDEHKLAIEGLRHLLGRVARRRRQPHLRTASSSSLGC